MSHTTKVIRPFLISGALSSRISTISATARRVPCFPRESNRFFSQSAPWQEKKYTDSHEWIELAGDGTAKIGITEYAAKSLGDVVFVELPTEGAEVNVGDSVGAVESVKSASDVLSPASGTVIEANTALDNKAKLINESPEDAGWIARIEVNDATELEELMDVDAYKESVAEH